MPYIAQEDRRKLDEMLHTTWQPDSPGELNYVITRLAHEYVELKGLKYATLNEVVGVLESAKMEFYRQVVAWYENMKKDANGSVSELDSFEQV